MATDTTQGSSAQPAGNGPSYSGWLSDFGQAVMANSPTTAGADLLKSWGNLVGAAAGTTASTANNLSGGMLGNGALIAIGVILALGALLIGSKETVVKIGDTATKAAALAA